MILKRSTNINLSELKEEFLGLAPIEDDSSPLNSLYQWVELQQIYNGAISEISTKLEILDDEFQINYRHNPIHHMECRLKSIHSIMDKLENMDQPKTIQSIKKNIVDIAGIRIICNYIEDIYKIEELLLNQDDITLIRRKDYIKNPKESGYRSLHLIVSIPVFLSRTTEIVPVEIQLRTITMDYWASLEHKLRYKTKSNDTDTYKKQLIDCSSQLAEIENTMQYIHQNINKFINEE